MTMTRPKLNEVPIPANPFLPGTLSITVSPGQWDNLIKGFYEAGHLLLEIEEVNGEEQAVRAYRSNVRTETPPNRDVQ
jgi:hypothetical protein